MQYRAVIFDMDGVLIDSEILYLTRTWKEMVKKWPWIAIEELYPSVGMDAERTRVLLHQVARKPMSDTVFDEEMDKIFDKTVIDHFTDVLYPEVPEVLSALKAKGYILALASSSPMDTIQRVLEECQLAKYFESVISGHQFKASKPDPEIYRTTMWAIDCQPQECLVVEDSTYGVAAGVAAGAKVAARLDLRFNFDQSNAAYFIYDLRELLAIL